MGGNLTIESLQNKDNYNEHSSNSGFGVVIPIGAGMPGLTVSHGNTNIDSNYQSTGTQSGIRAGDGGFQVNVAGDTTLKGGAITSTQKAVDEGKNSFHTGGQLVMSDLQNQAEYNASGSQITLGVGGSRGSSSAGVGRDNGSASSTTQAGISGIAGNSSARTGDKETGLKPIFDKERVRDNVDAGVTVTTVVGQQGTIAWGDYANQQYVDAITSGDSERAECWAPDGTCRAAGHALVGGLTGGLGGAVAGGAVSITAPQVERILTDAGLPPMVVEAVTQAYGAGLGGAVGGTGGAAAGLNESGNNTSAANFLITQGIRFGGPAAARACLLSPSCMNIVAGVIGTSAGVWLADIANSNDQSTNSVTLGDVNPHIFGGTESLNPADESQRPTGAAGKPIQEGKPGDNIIGTPNNGPQGESTTGGKPIAQPKPGDNIISTPVTDPLPGTGILMNEEGNDSSSSARPSPILIDSPYNPSNVDDRVKPPYQTNPAHDIKSPLYNPNKTPEPSDAQSAYENGAVRGGMGTWYAKGEKGYYQYFSDNAGTVHFSGAIPDFKVPSGVRKILGR
ncbi:hypothetical protein ABE501_20135 [Comamonas testosteroni]